MKVNKPEAEKTAADKAFEALAATMEQSNIEAALTGLTKRKPAPLGVRRTY